MSWSIEIYKLDSLNSRFVKLAVIDNYENASFFFRKNSYGSASFQLDVYNEYATRYILRRYANIVAFKFNRKIIWAGPITHVGGDLGEVNGKVQVECAEYFYKLFQVYTAENVQFVQTDQGAIVESLINTAQAKTAGDLLINVQSYSATTNRDRSYSYGQVGQLTEDLTQVGNGLDFLLTPTQDADNNLSGFNLNLYENFGTQKTNLNKLVLGASVRNVSFATQGEIANNITAVSNTQGNQKFIATAVDSISRDVYNNLELIEKFYDIVIQQTLDEKAADLAAENSLERLDINCQLYPNQFDLLAFSVGDQLYLDLQVGRYLTVEGWHEVKELNYIIDPQGQFFPTVKFTISE